MPRVEQTVKVRRKNDGTLHDCLLSAVNYARSEGYELVDPEEYKRLRKTQNACHVAEGDVIAPQTAKRGKKVLGVPTQVEREQIAAELPGETTFIPFG